MASVVARRLGACVLVVVGSRRGGSLSKELTGEGTSGGSRNGFGNSFKTRSVRRRVIAVHSP